MTTVPSDGPVAAPGPRSDEHWTGVLYAYVWLALLPVSFLLGFGAAHLPYMVFTDQVEGTPGPWWFELLVALVGMGVMWLPVGASLVQGRRALRAGSRAAAWIVIGVDLALTALALVVVVASAMT